ncbi:MAG: M20 family metallo-hydrolase [Proteobacteria bacterium]|nr:M20 family metallo-hydrolase [Pseudomonadota bacterium]
MSKSVADHVVRDRLWKRHLSMACHGATPADGVNRQALSAAEVAARRELIAWGGALGLAAFTDAAGNFFLRLEGRDPDAAPVLSGSHLDSQPTGGRFDGVYGVLAAFEAVQAICDSGQTPGRAIEIVAWMNEEGSRFAPGMMGSAAFAGEMALAELLPVRDADGHTVEQGLADMARAFPDVPQRALGRKLAAYVDAHIEQGPVLEKQGFSVGVVTGIQGKRTFRVSVSGEDAHAGTAPLRERKDALLAATAMIQALSRAMHDDDDIVKFTVGRLEVKPNAPSVVAGHAQFSIDLRHPVEARLRELGDRVAAVCRECAGPCTVGVEELVTAWPLEFPAQMQAEVRNAAKRLGLRSMDLPSAAGHDARYLHGVCPAAMIFVPCKDGISHNEAESATPDDLYDGARVLAETLMALAGR